MQALSKQTLSNILFACLAGTSGILFVVFVLVLAGVLPIDSPAEPAAEPAARTAERTARPTPRPAPAAAPARTSAPAQTQAPERPRPAVAVMTAVRGDSWFSARLGSAQGRVLDERVLARGESVRLEGRRIWLSVGAAGNVDLTVDGKPLPLASGTVSVVVTAARPS